MYSFITKLNLEFIMKIKFIFFIKFITAQNLFITFLDE